MTISPKSLDEVKSVLWQISQQHVTTSDAIIAARDMDVVKAKALAAWRLMDRGK